MNLRVQCATPEEPIHVFVVLKKREHKQIVSVQVGICQTCWEKIGDKKWECGDSLRISIKELTSDKARGLEGAVLTEYKPKENKKLADQEEDDEEY
jgi:hypothetical protein